MLLDQGVLEDEGFLLCSDLGDLDLGRGGHQVRHSGALILPLHILADTRPQVLGLSDIDHTATRVEEQIDPRSSRQIRRLVPQRLRDDSAHSPPMMKR